MPAHDFAWWTKLITKSRDDATVVDAFAAAGLPKVPKPPRSENSVQVELDGSGLEVTLTKVDGGVVFSGVLAKIDEKHGDDLYRGKLLEGVSAKMSQAAVRQKLGQPDQSIDDGRIDVWLRGATELIVGYTKDRAISTFSLTLPDIW